VSVRERMMVDGVPIDEDRFAEWTTFLQPHIERLDASFFEATTAIAFADLAARHVDIAVIEVGLGGCVAALHVLTCALRAARGDWAAGAMPRTCSRRWSPRSRRSRSSTSNTWDLI